MLDFLSSNAIQVLLTIGAGSLAYFAIARFPAILTVLSVAICAILLVSFSLDVGEVYRYSAVYKRAYWWFGDDVTNWLAPLVLLAVVSLRPILGTVLAAGILVSGGRVAMLLLLLQLVVVLVVYRGLATRLLKTFCLSFVGALGVYAILVVCSPYLISGANHAYIAMARVVKVEAGEGPFAQSIRGRGNCTVQDCFETKFKRPAMHRAYGALAGLWMTAQGGFRGASFPNTSDKFSDLMVAANPWGINDRFEISRDDWRRIGTINTPYLQFGAGYGPVLMLALIAVVATISFIGVCNIRTMRKGQPDPLVVLAGFFVVNAVFNQTQAWMNPGPVLFGMGLSGTYVLWFWNSERLRHEAILDAARIGDKVSARHPRRHPPVANVADALALSELSPIRAT